MRVDERMTKNISSCRAEDTLAAAANQLWEHDCGSLPVIDDRGHVRGMITDRDICMAAMISGKPLGELRVADAMAKDVATTGPSDSLEDAELLMRSRAVRRLPVVDDQHRVIGILTCNDLLRWVDDGGQGSDTNHHAVHLVRTLAAVGRPRLALTGRVIARPSGIQPVATTAPASRSVPEYRLGPAASGMPIYDALVTRARNSPHG